MKLKIEIINKATDELLYEFEYHQSDEAYEVASQLEDFGLDVMVKSPTISDILSDSLEVRSDEYDESDESCCHSFLDTALRLKS